MRRFRARHLHLDPESSIGHRLDILEADFKESGSGETLRWFSPRTDDTVNRGPGGYACGVSDANILFNFENDWMPGLMS